MPGREKVETNLSDPPTNNLNGRRREKKFEFCGKLDCPDWVLAQLFHASKLDLSEFKTICEGVKDAIELARGGEEGGGCFDEKTRLFDKLQLDDDKFDIDDARACFAAVDYIISNARLYGTSGDILSTELEQLGLPSEHSQTLCSLMEEI